MSRLFLILLPAAVLLPFFHVGGWGFSLRLEVVAAAVLSVSWWAGFSLRGKLLFTEEARLLVWFAGLLILISVSVLVAIVFLGYAPSARDLSELLRVIVYGALLWLGVVFRRRQITPSRVAACFLGAAVLAVFVGFLQYFDCFGINNWLTPLYTGAQLRGVVVQQRIIGTFSNPNEFGAFLVLPAAISLGTILLSDRPACRVLCWMLLTIFAVGVILTGSRTAVASLLIMVLTVLLLAAPRVATAARVLRTVIGVLLGCAVALSVVWIVGPSQPIQRFGEIADVRRAGSWQGRVEDWSNDLDAWFASPITGWGPGEADMESTVDNEWLLIMRRYGILGLIWFVIGGVAVLVALSGVLRRAQSLTGKVLATALIGVIPAYAFYMIFAAVYHAPQLMPPLLLVVGVALADRHSNSHRTYGAIRCT